MSERWESSLGAPLVAALEELGYTPGTPATLECTIPALRGTNIVLASPPSARYAIPALAGMLAALRERSGRLLLLAPATALEEWLHALLPLARATGLSLEIATTPGRAARRLRAGSLHVLLTAPEVALELQQSSALKVEEVTHLVLAWPDLFPESDALSALLSGLDKDAPRLVHLATQSPSRELVDRYARRAVVAGPLATPFHPGANVRTMIVDWGRRAQAVRGLLEALDPRELTIWAADRGSAQDAAAGTGAIDGVTVVTGDDATAGTVLAWDLPTPAVLESLASRGEVILLYPPHAVSYVERTTATRKPVRGAGPVEAAQAAGRARRAAIEASIRSSDDSGSLLELAPLFERHDPADVAAALYRLWTAKAPVEIAAPALAIPSTARIWIGTGKKDEVTPNDLVAALTRELGVERSRIGKIDVRELYCLVELPAEEAEAIARRLNGVTIRRRRVTARVDRGTPERRPTREKR